MTHRQHRIGGVLRGAVLMAVWSIPAAWCLAHTWDHARHAHHAGEHLEREAGPVVAVEATHGHGHTHPEILPVAINGKNSHSVALVAAFLALDLEPPEISQPLVRAAPGRGSSWTGAPTGPRAPPSA